jgi:23S rRNA pseudouridine1911/1915/1917 synthase
MAHKGIKIIHEDNHILVVLKPSGVPVQEDSSGDVSLQRHLKQYLIESTGKEGDAYLGIVHRLDRPTAGLMVFAKTSKAAERLSKVIAKKSAEAVLEKKNDDEEDENIEDSDLFLPQEEGSLFEKTYYAVVEGILKNTKSSFSHYLKKNEIKNVVQIVGRATEGAKAAHLHYEVIEEMPTTQIPASLVKINLLTGRSHQIRAQFSYMGHPIFGDIKYGANEKTATVKLALCATELKFYHPVTGDKMNFIVYPPITESPWKAFDMSRHLSRRINN